MKIRFQFLALGTVAAMGLAGMVTAASATPPASGTVMAVTHASHHPDTATCVTSNPGTGNGYVWAYDNLSRQITATPTSTTGVWTVIVVDNGSFAAFSEPNSPTNCSADNPINVTGSVRGTITYTVTSTATPDATNLPAQMNGATSTSDTIRTLFNDPAATFAGGAYLYTYRSGTNVYSQDGGITGNITGH